MKSNNLVVEIKNLVKTYKIYKTPKDLFNEVVFGKINHDEYKALKGINLTIKKGEVIGIIGRNGAGKSTLLKILTGVLDKTSGSIKVNGKITAILELGSGFNPEYTGRENIYNGGMVLGMSRKEINDRIDSIIEFSELGEFIDRPFKTYSDGMKTRLTFSVATAIKPDILVIDEALAAGDSFFINKCIQRITELCRSSATVLLVSHNTFLLQRLCTRAVLLEHGVVKTDGDPILVCQDYEYAVMQEVNKKLKIDNSQQNKKILGGEDISINKVIFLNQKNEETYQFTQGEPLTIRFEYDSRKKFLRPAVYCLFTKSDGIYATSFFSGEKESFHDRLEIESISGKGVFELKWPQILLGDGDYYITLGIFPYRTDKEGIQQLDPLVFHDKAYQIKVERPFRPLQTIFDQNITVNHRRASGKL